VRRLNDSKSPVRHLADRGSHEKNEKLLLDSKSTVKLTFLSCENKKKLRFNTASLQKEQISI
jgi:hypothetical protein